MKINIECQGSSAIALEDLHIIQGDLKELSKENYKKLKNEIIEMGFSEPCSVWHDGTKWCLLNGTQRVRTLLAMKAEGFEIPKIPVSEVRAVDLKEAQRKLLSLASQYGEVTPQGLYEFMSNADIEFNEMDSRYRFPEIKNDDFKEEFFEDPKSSEGEDDVPEITNSSHISLGDLFILDHHRLLCADSTHLPSVERLMNDEKAELCFTSPPYGDQREYNKKDLNLDIEHISQFISASHAHVNYYAVVLGTMRKEGEVFSYWDTFIKTARECGLKLLSWNIWNKMNDALMFSFNQMFAVNHEWIFVFGNDSKKLIPTVKNQHGGELNDHVSVRVKDGRVKKMDKVSIREFSQLRTIIDCTPQKARSNDFDHPAMFCVELPERYIEAFVEKKSNVYEPFSGSGTTLIACEKTNRKCFAMEIDPKYCAVIIERWMKFSGKMAYREELDGSLKSYEDIKNDNSTREIKIGE